MENKIYVWLKDIIKGQRKISWSAREDIIKLLLELLEKCGKRIFLSHLVYLKCFQVWLKYISQRNYDCLLIYVGNSKLFSVYTQNES